jgi:hypothetical protein
MKLFSSWLGVGLPLPTTRSQQRPFLPSFIYRQRRKREIIEPTRVSGGFAE